VALTALVQRPILRRLGLPSRTQAALVVIQAGPAKPPER
jgi:DNA-binding NarL/FixJ family response regulator